MEVEIEEIQAVANPAHGNRIKNIPVKARMPKEMAQFYQKRHTTVEKEERPTRISEIRELMEFGFKDSLHPLRPDKLVQANACIPYVRKII